MILFHRERKLTLSTPASTTESFRLDGKVAVVTGGASGIGRAIAHRFAKSGGCVRILDIDGEQAELVALEIIEAGGNAAAFQCDVTRQENVKAVFERLLQKDRIQILVNNAGTSHVGSLEATKECDLDRI